MSVTAGTLALILISAIISTSYLVLREDILNATISQHARAQHAYEDRITALRAQVDLLTSRQMLDQQAVEERVAKLMERQNELGLRQRHVSEALGRAAKAKAVPAMRLPVLQRSKPETSTGLRLGSLVGTSDPFATASATASDPEFFDSLEAALAETEQQQLAELRSLKRSADHKASKLASILSRRGIRVPDTSAVGGPLIALKAGNKFLGTVNALDASLEMLEQVRRAAKSVPHGSPTPGKKISSRFGTRNDPFTGGHAMHGGLDFKAKRGAPVVATASGEVTRAGRAGGYGKLVEIDHGGGITTRYAHLSKIHVKVGQRIARGKRIGRVGSTGRSTGPHLHYEVRRKGRVLDPIHFVKLEKHLKPYL